MVTVYVPKTATDIVFITDPHSLVTLQVYVSFITGTGLNVSGLILSPGDIFTVALGSLAVQFNVRVSPTKEQKS